MDMTQALTVLTVASGLALVVERVLELVKQIVQLDHAVLPDRLQDQADNQLADAIQQARVALAQGEAGADPRVAPGQSAVTQVQADASTTPIPALGVQLEPVTRRDSERVSRVAFYQIFTLGFGILLAALFEVRLFDAFLSQIYPAFARLPLLDEVLTGVVIGGGSQPVHLLLRFLTERGLNAEQRPATNTD